MLYYLYTDKVLFSTNTTVKDPLDIPVSDAEDVFEIAHLYDLPQLKEKALHFLVETCNTENIIERVFGRFALTYEEVSGAYAKVFYRYWNEVKDLLEFEKFFEELEDQEDITRRTTVNRRYRELMRSFPSQVM